jgi:acyl-CoA hydrolase
MPAETISPQQAASLVKSGMWLDYGATLCEPDVFDKALAARKHELENVKIRTCLSMRPRAVIEEDPEGKHFHLFSWHFSTYERRKHEVGRCNYTPLNLGEVPDYYRRFLDPIDIVILKTCPMDDGGYFNFGPTSLWQRTVVERAKLVIVEINRDIPYVFGKDNGVHLHEVDYIIEGDHQPCPELPNPEASEIDRTVARRIAAEVEDGSCLQIGIGGMPNAVCALLMDSGVKDLGIHTEMLTDGLGLLYRSGRVTGSRKTLDPGKVVYTFSLGSLGLYATANRNPDFYCQQVEYTNSPHIIMQNDKVVSINNTTQIDLQGQAASESDGHRHISGTGGQLQFVRGAYASKGGKSFMCLSSTYEKRGERRSRIVFDLTCGNIVTTPRSDVMYVVTEFGMVNLKGKCVAERAKAIIGLAHPDYREELERQAYENRLIPRGVSFSCRRDQSEELHKTQAFS